jgi:hypothetical protein
MLLRWWVGARTVAIRASPASIFFEDQEMTSLSKMISLSNRIQGHFLPAETSTELCRKAAENQRSREKNPFECGLPLPGLREGVRGYLFGQ